MSIYGFIALLENEGAGTFTEPVMYLGGRLASSATVADLDLDGDDEVILAETPSGRVGIVRGGTGSGNAFCFGDGSGVACPCAPGAAGSGCANSSGRGARLAAQGGYSVAADDLWLACSDMLPGSFSMLLQSTVPANAGLGATSVASDGLSCLGGGIVRIGLRGTIGSSARFHGVARAGGVGAAGGQRFYQVVYRNQAAYCTPARWNSSNGLAITWSP